MESNKNFTNLIGVPYLSCNCWRLCQLFYKQVLNIELNNYFEKMPDNLKDRQNLVHTNVGDFTPTENPQFGDLIFLKILGYESHIAIYIGAGRMLHTTEKLGSHIDRVSKWRTMITGYYRLGGGMND